MSQHIVSTANAEHYMWGEDRCDGWFLVRAPDLHVIEERMPAGATDSAHHHTYARQFFYVLDGELTIRLREAQVLLRSGQGVEIAPGEVHQALNQGPGAVRFLVTSQPPSHGDRTDV